VHCALHVPLTIAAPAELHDPVRRRWLAIDARATNGSTPLPWWAPRPGRLSAGRADLPGWPANATRSEAEVACAASAACVGYSYGGSPSLPPNVSTLMHLKSAGDADDDARWTTVFKPAPIQPFDGCVNASCFPRQSTAYTALLRTGPRSASLVYDQWRHHMGNVWRVYAMRVEV
jgi:hypothetical protein